MSLSVLLEQAWKNLKPDTLATVALKLERAYEKGNTTDLYDLPTHPVLWSSSGALTLSESQLEWAWLHYFASLGNFFTSPLSAKAGASGAAGVLTERQRMEGLSATGALSAAEYMLSTDLTHLFEPTNTYRLDGRPYHSNLDELSPAPTVLVLSPPEKTRAELAKQLKVPLSYVPKDAQTARDNALDVTYLPWPRVLLIKMTEMAKENPKLAELVSVWKKRNNDLLALPIIYDPVASALCKLLSQYRAWDDAFDLHGNDRWAFYMALAERSTTRPMPAPQPPLYLQDADSKEDEQRLQGVDALGAEQRSDRELRGKLKDTNPLAALAWLRDERRLRTYPTSPYWLPTLITEPANIAAVRGPFPLEASAARWLPTPGWVAYEGQPLVTIQTCVSRDVALANQNNNGQRILLLLREPAALPLVELKTSGSHSLLVIHASPDTLSQVFHPLHILLAQDTVRAHWHANNGPLERWFSVFAGLRDKLPGALLMELQSQGTPTQGTPTLLL